MNLNLPVQLEGRGRLMRQFPLSDKAVMQMKIQHVEAMHQPKAQVGTRATKPQVVVCCLLNVMFKP